MGLIKNQNIFSDDPVSFQKDNNPTPETQTRHEIIKTMDLKASVNKDKRILVQGLLQAVLQSQGLLLEPNDGYVNKVKAVTLELVKFVEENSK